MQRGKKTELKKEPFLTGSPVDANTRRGALGVLGGLAVMALAFLLLGSMLTFDSLPLRIGANLVLLFTAYSIFYVSGASAGTGDVGHGEIMYRRRQTDREITPRELARCYHPLKGFVTGLLGTLPLLLCAIVFALIARRQMSTMGVLPSWISGVQGRADIMAPLAAYTAPVPITLESLLRIILRIVCMPFVSMVGAANSGSLLVLERLTPLLVLLPACCFGLGYLQGVNQRARVHTDIAQNRKKQAQRARREKARREAAGKPQALN